MNVKTITQNRTKVLSGGFNDVVNENILIKDSPAPSALVTAQNDLANLPAYPAGFKAMWQLSAAGDWISVL